MISRFTTMCCAIAAALIAALPAAAQDTVKIASVSYTHLDVYKRQGIDANAHWMGSIVGAGKRVVRGQRPKSKRFNGRPR